MKIQKLLKQMACLSLSTILLINSSACTKKIERFSHENIIKMAEEFDIDEYDDENDLFNDIAYMSKESCGYVTVTDDDATEFYDRLINRFKSYKDYDILEFTAIAYSDGWQNYLFFMTFESERKASKFFDEFVDHYSELEENDDEDDYLYAISGKDPDADDERHGYKGAYLQGDKVLLIMSITADTDAIDDFCEYLDIISPAEEI